MKILNFYKDIKEASELTRERNGKKKNDKDDFSKSTVFINDDNI